MGKDKWDKVIEYLTHSNRDPEKVLNLLKGNQKGVETSYTVGRSSYSLNVIATITQKIMDPKNKGKTLTHVIRTWCNSKDFEDFYNLMKVNEKKTYDKSKLFFYVKQINDIWAKPNQKKWREYFKKTKGFLIIKDDTSPNKTMKKINNRGFHSSLLKLK